MSEGVGERLEDKTTVLFTDIVGSTALAARLGDMAWADLLRRHHSAVREQLGHFGGVEMDNAGDGFFAIFSGPADAVACVVTVGKSLRRLGIQIRAAIHAGDCVVVGSKCTGLAVHIGARLIALANPGEVIVSEWVKHRGPPDIEFIDRGIVELRDVPGRWHIYAIELEEHPSAITSRSRAR